ncbi:hypothetical protein HHI36_019545 [Cryptolaemus montrouzieri]|uniref:Uncharacterized protein n=1 Tax=Cryptolaemus montrouzieri TaxID=559131 RepID=A0ABD2N8V4_9CUCU
MVDLLFTDNQNIGALVLKSRKWSDHDIIHFLTGGVSGHPKELVTKRFRDCSKIDKSKFQQLMMGQKWETPTDVDSSVDQFYARRVTVEIIPMQVEHRNQIFDEKSEMLKIFNKYFVDSVESIIKDGMNTNNGTVLNPLVTYCNCSNEENGKYTINDKR